MADAESWKNIGNQCFRKGDYAGAISAYENALAISKTAIILSNLSQVYLRLNKFPQALDMALQAVDVDPDYVKGRYRSATAYRMLRSYSHARDALLPVDDKTTDITGFLAELNARIDENMAGQYDMKQIRSEPRETRRRRHADFCSPMIELHMVNGSTRGIIAKQDIPQGQLLVASKALLCIYSDEIDETDVLVVGNETLVPSLAGRICQMINGDGYGFAILTLAGGPMSSVTEITLSEDQAALLEAWQGPREVSVEDAVQIVRQNSLKTWLNTNDENGAWGLGIFRVLSYFNHSCMPNTICFIYGDIVLMWSSRRIHANEEIFLSYDMDSGNRFLQEREHRILQSMNPFVCCCTLCEYQRDNREMVHSAYKIAMDAQFKFKYRDMSLPEEVLVTLETVYKEVYRLFGRQPPSPSFDVLRFEVNTPQEFSFAQVMVVVVNLLVRAANATKSGPTDFHGEAPDLLASYSRERHAFWKANYCLLLPSFERTAADSALHLSFISGSHQLIQVSSRWLAEAEEIGYFFLGQDEFEEKYSDKLPYIRLLLLSAE